MPALNIDPAAPLGAALHHREAAQVGAERFASLGVAGPLHGNLEHPMCIVAVNDNHLAPRLDDHVVRDIQVTHGDVYCIISFKAVGGTSQSIDAGRQVDGLCSGTEVRLAHGVAQRTV